MARKKYTLMLGLLGLISTASMAQDGTASTSSSDTTSYSDNWAFDPSYVRSGKVAAQNAFLSYQNPYPAKPRNMMEFGIGVGPTMMFSTIDPQISYGASASLRKAISNVFSIRAQYGYGSYKGLDYRARSASYLPSAVQKAYGGGSYVANYKAIIQNASLDVIASLNSISSYRGNPKMDVYLLAGYSYVWGNSSINLYDANGSKYSYASLGDNTRIDKGNVKDAFKDGQSSSLVANKSGNGQQYETSLTKNLDGHNDVASGGNGHNNISRHGADFGGGIAFKVSPRFNIGIEQKFTYLFDNGAFAGVVTGPNTKNDILSNTQVRFNFNLGASSKRIEPLWWVNPNNYVYSELNSPRHLKVGLTDTDGDGVPDALDLEPNTPAGAPVDTHGRALDTDGDGVPDYKDKQKLTPQSWFPVDADGVGTEPEPECCKELRDKLANYKGGGDCAITSLPSVQFKKGTVSLSSAAKASLASVASQMNANPACKVKVIGYGASNKKSQQLSWDHVNAVIKYLVENQGISESRLLFFYGQDGDVNTVDLQSTTEDGPNTVPAPHPNLQKTK